MLSVIIPLAPRELLWRNLVHDLNSALEADDEIILVSPDAKPKELPERCQWVSAKKGRARQLNSGAIAAKNPFLWFLHADTRVKPAAVSSLKGSLEESPGALHYFRLAFASDGPKLARLNALGANIRSRFLSIPFGDQGFCVSKAYFEMLGGYDESAPYGEDHLFAWKVRQARLELKEIAETLETSARKYKDRGWLPTTLSHWKITAQQAFPQYLELKMTKPGALAALAVFVKTPKLSKLKTRLAAGIGEQKALRFYSLAIAAVSALLKKCAASDFKPYWAVAELRGLEDEAWTEFPVLFQGEGGLGQRLHKIYSELFPTHWAVFVMGADSPQLAPEFFADALSRLREGNDFVISRTKDGGFSLLGGKRPIPPSVWLETPYSQADTAEMLVSRLRGLGKVLELPESFDVDTFEDLRELASFRDDERLLPEQREVIRWSKTLA